MWPRCRGKLQELVSDGARPHEVTAALLSELDKRPPTLLVLEDLHWADEATLDVFRLLARRVESVRALTVASFRDDELDRAPQLRIVLGELPGGPRRLKLASLSLDAVREMAAPHGVDGHELHTKTGGNPFFVTEVLGAPSERIPETVRDAVLARAERLPEPARRLLQALAVVPGRVELWLLAALAGKPADRLEQCLASGVLTVVDGGVAYRHELAREAVETTLPPDRRLALHRAALTALSAPSAGDPDPTRLSHHAEAVGDAEAVLVWAPQAAVRAAGAGAHREAAAQYARALRFSDRLTAEARAELLERRAYECFLVNESTETIASLQQAIELSRWLGDRLRLGRLLCSLARALHESGRDSEGTALVREAVELLEPLGESRELGRAFGTRAQFCMLTDDLEQTVMWGDKAIELADRLNDTETLVHALNTVGTALLNVGSPEGAERLERSLRLARSAGLDVDVGRGVQQSRGGSTRLARLRSRRTLCRARNIEYCEDGAVLSSGASFCRQTGLGWKLDRGRWERAGEAANALLSDRRCTVSVRSEALVSLGLVRARRGDPGDLGAAGRGAGPVRLQRGDTNVRADRLGSRPGSMVGGQVDRGREYHRQRLCVDACAGCSVDNRRTRRLALARRYSADALSPGKRRSLLRSQSRERELVPRVSGRRSVVPMKRRWRWLTAATRKRSLKLSTSYGCWVGVRPPRSWRGDCVGWVFGGRPEVPAPEHARTPPA